MSRILRRPMFRGGPASSEGVGITSGLNNPRQGYADGPYDQGVQSYDESGSSIVNAQNPNYLGWTGSQDLLVDKYTKEIQDRFKKNEQEKPKENVRIVQEKQTAPTMAQDIDTYTKLLMNNAGSDKDEYTRQKYLTLAKFGLNLLKPTPVGIKPSLATSLASAAEKPLEEYGNISMQQSKEDKALRQAAVQLGIQKHMPGNIAKGIQDLMAMNPNMTAQEATSIYTTGKNSAAIAKEKFNEVIQRQKEIEDLATKDPALKKLSKIDPTFSNTYAQIATEQGLYGHELKGLASDYNVYQPGSIYYAPDKQTGQLLPHKFIKGKFYSIREPEFKQKGI